MKGNDQQPKDEGGDPGTKARAKLRNQCKPQGPCGLLLESIHLQSASLDELFQIRQFNQQPVEVVGGPAQLVVPLLIRMAARNRTRRCEGSREETEGLIEIDTYATNAKHRDEVADDEGKMVLRLRQSGSNWTQAVTARTGREDVEVANNKCDLCMKMKETSDHLWHCESLSCKRRELDVELAEADPSDFTPAMRQGVACAMNADPTRTYWGLACEGSWTREKKRWYGCYQEKNLSAEVSEVVRTLKSTEGTEEMTAREVMEKPTAKEVGVLHVMPKMGCTVSGTAPKYPNAFSDGSLKNTRGYFWMVGGAGVWWPGRKLDTLNEEEKSITEYKEVEDIVDSLNPDSIGPGAG